jgi:hypothetical protein
MSDNLCDIDFSRSYLRFRTTRVNHTPRLQVDALCALLRPDGTTRKYFLTCACIGEAMYVETNLIHEPVSEFNLIAAPGEEFLLLKRHAEARHDTRSAHQVGDTMPTHDGRGAQVMELEVALAHVAMQPIESYHQFRDALLNNRPINARTTYKESDGTQVTLEYPARTVNVSHERDAWQVDAGPIVMPRGEETTGTLEVARLDLAYLVFNRWDYAEAVLQDAPPDSNGNATKHYRLRRNLCCRNELFVAM